MLISLTLTQMTHSTILSSLSLLVTGRYCKIFLELIFYFLCLLSFLYICTLHKLYNASTLSSPLNNIQFFGHTSIFTYGKPKPFIICLALYNISDNRLSFGTNSLMRDKVSLKQLFDILCLLFSLNNRETTNSCVCFVHPSYNGVNVLASNL